MNKIASFVVSRPGLIIAVTLAVTLGFAVALATNGIQFNSAPETLARHDEAFDFFRQTQATFADENVIIVAFDAVDIFTAEAKDRLEELTARLASLPGVASAVSLTNLNDIKRDDGGILIEKLLPLTASTAELQRLKPVVLADPLYARHYVSTDGRTAAINVFLESQGINETRALAEEIERLVKAESRGDLWLAGLPLMDAKGSRSMTEDMLLLSPVAALLCGLVFIAAFRSLWGALLPMLALGMGLVWTVSLMGLLGKPITIATLTLPVVLLAVGSSYIFHILNQYRLSMATLDNRADQLGQRQAQRQAWLGGLRFILPAVLVSGATTVAGFASLISSPVPAAKDMGIFEATGVAFMMLLTMLFVPAALTLLPPQALGQAVTAAGAPQKDYAIWLNRLLKQVTALILFRGRGVLVVATLLTLLVGVGVYRLRVNTDYLSSFPRQSDVPQTTARLHERLAGASAVQIVVAGDRGAATTPAFLNAVETLEQFAVQQPGVDATLSVTDIVKKFNDAMPGKPEEVSRAIPQNPARLQSIFDNYLSQDASLRKLVSGDSAQALVMLRTNLFASDELRALTDSLDRKAQESLPAGMTARVTGSLILLNNASDDIAASQSSSLAIALLTISVMMVLLFRSLRTGLLALLPNLLPIAGYFGFLGWTGIPLDITTSLVASSVLGLAVDNAVHIIRRYRQSLAERPPDAKGNDTGWALWLTMLRTGKPTTLANLMLVAAFLLFMMSSFNPVRTGGMLWALTIFACLAADLIFLPALMQTRLFAQTAAAGNVDAEQAHYPYEIRKAADGTRQRPADAAAIVTGDALSSGASAADENQREKVSK